MVTITVMLSIPKSLSSLIYFRTEGYPDQYDRAVKCIDKYVPEICDIRFPETLAFAEHFSNVTFYQAAAAAVKNVQQFCFVCRSLFLDTLFTYFIAIK